MKKLLRSNFIFLLSLFSLAHAADSYRINVGSSQFISAFGICATVQNSKALDLFVPTKSEAEWKSFMTVSTNLVTKNFQACSCKSLRLAGNTTSGIYNIDPDGPGPQSAIDLYCDMTTDGGGWTLIGRSASGDSGTNFGWNYYRGDINNHSQCYSANIMLTGMYHTEVLFGDISSGNSWGSNVYKKPFSSSDASYFTSAPTPTPTTPIIGGNGNFGMAAFVGATSSNNFFYFRDNADMSVQYGLNCGGWDNCYPDGAPSPGYNGWLTGRQGMVMVR